MNYQFGRNAICLTSEHQRQFHAHAQQLVAEIQPATFLENLLTDELLHASWELDRIRALTISEHLDAEPRLHRATLQATRTWARARKLLAKRGKLQ